MIRNLVLDMGNVLLQFDPLAAAKEFYPDGDDARRVIDALVGQPWWSTSDAGQITDEELTALAQDYLRETGYGHLAEPLTRFMTDWPPRCLTRIPGMEKLIDAAKDAGMGVYLLSNAGPSLRLYQELLPRVERFDGILFSAEAKLLKPCPAMFRYFCERFGLKAEECFFVDDLLTNVLGARRAGMQAYLFDGDQPRLMAALGL